MVPFGIEVGLPADRRASNGTHGRRCGECSQRRGRSLLIDEHGDRKWGKKTAHVGRQWLANIGKTEDGVLSLSSLWADERIYHPVAFEPYTPAHHFEGGKQEPHLRTKLKIASQLVELAVGEGIPFRARFARDGIA
jgi:SRSO17 transposase